MKTCGEMLNNEKERDFGESGVGDEQKIFHLGNFQIRLNTSLFLESEKDCLEIRNVLSVYKSRV